jgi:hypothetical protein
MDKTLRRYSSHAEMKADEYRAWAAMSGRDRLQAVADLTTEAYRLKGLITDVPRLQRTLVRVQRPPR